MHQLSLFADSLRVPKVGLTHTTFSHNGVCPEAARQALEHRYAHLLEETDRFSRQLVSFQANKTETLHGWIKYREGFSAALVERLIGEFGLGPDDCILDPFAGSATTLLVAKMMGLDAVGIELLPHCHLAWKAKSAVFDYDLAELHRLREMVQTTTPPPSSRRFPHLQITESAFPEKNEADLMAYFDWFATSNFNEHTKLLCSFILMSILEEISYTRKDGQYLRWDGRATKIQKRNQIRIQKGQSPIEGINKGELPSVKEAFMRLLDKIIIDIKNIQNQPPLPSSQKLLEGSALYILPTLENNQFSAVITSPPYANRYDYTRTYALELAYLGVGDDIFRLRQELLSCTVENRSKLDILKQKYHEIKRDNFYNQVLSVIHSNVVINEINQALLIRNKRGDINNSGIINMIEQYFTEMTFIYAELFRVCRPGAYVAFINDNVRYAGEIIPVDLISTEIAESLNFEPIKVYVLPQRKGNSSQQMERFGREPLRKSITIWRKPYATQKTNYN